VDQVLARIKGRGKKKVFKLLSDFTLFKTINITANACIEYNPDHNLDEDSWFKIDDFSQQAYCLEFLKPPFDSKSYDDLPKADFTDIAYLCALQGNDFYFQKITPSLFMTKKMIAFGEVATVEENDKRLVVNTLPDAIYQKGTDTLVFRNLASISSMFKGIDGLYKAATEAEVKQFLDESFVELASGYDAKKVSKPNRKRIALAMATLTAMSDPDRKGMLTYIDSYCKKELKFDQKNHKFEITTDNELKLLLYGIEQRFYTTPIGNEKRLANSVQAMTA
jgi:hypothetical protein